MLVFISIIIWIVYTIFAIAILDLEKYKKNPITKKYIWPQTKQEHLRVWLGILSIAGLAGLLIFMHDYHEDLLGQIYTYIGVVIVIMWGIAIVFLGANPWKK